MFHTASGGGKPNYKELVRLNFLMANAISNDQAVHLARAPEQSLDSAAHQVKLIYPRLRLCFA